MQDYRGNSASPRPLAPVRELSLGVKGICPWLRSRVLPWHLTGWLQEGHKDGTCRPTGKPLRVCVVTVLLMLSSCMNRTQDSASIGPAGKKPPLTSSDMAGELMEGARRLWCCRPNGKMVALGPRSPCQASTLGAHGAFSTVTPWMNQSHERRLKGTGTSKLCTKVSQFFNLIFNKHTFLHNVGKLEVGTRGQTDMWHGDPSWTRGSATQICLFQGSFRPPYLEWLQTVKEV
ncbi:uncharacterized protein LOC121916768 [Sceloporus undulatus]|uniref:uncharacterized protein LOC121916768 n=1 Tax=Sceloporus undulatus TaxID=8520 RepID=UPI001C4BC7B9|nr:uncharacterized protein LOC121916768 [Sceloporus undulatus]